MKPISSKNNLNKNTKIGRVRSLDGFHKIHNYRDTTKLEGKNFFQDYHNQET